MGKSTNFIGQPLLCQLLKFFDKDKILRLSREKGGERYVNYVYSVEIPELNETNSIAFKQPVHECVVRSAEERIF